MRPPSAYPDAVDYDEPTAGHLRCFFGDGQGWAINWLEDTPNICWSTWWVQICFYVTPDIGELIQFDEHVSEMGGNHQLLIYQEKFLDV